MEQLQCDRNKYKYIYDENDRMIITNKDHQHYRRLVQIISNNADNYITEKLILPSVYTVKYKNDIFHIDRTDCAWVHGHMEPLRDFCWDDLKLFLGFTRLIELERIYPTERIVVDEELYYCWNTMSYKLPSRLPFKNRIEMAWVKDEYMIVRE